MNDAAKALYRWTTAQTAAAAVLTPIRHRVYGRAHGAVGLADLCFFGEDVAVAYMRAYVEADAARLGGVLAVDVLSTSYAVEVKAGLVSNSRNAQHWRLTFSAERGLERSKMDRMTPGELKAYRARKKGRILTRKENLLVGLRSLTHRDIRPATVTMIVDPARQDVDVFWFDGWHHRIGWKGREADAGFRGSYHVAWAGRSNPSVPPPRVALL